MSATHRPPMMGAQQQVSALAPLYPCVPAHKVDALDAGVVGWCGAVAIVSSVGKVRFSSIGCKLRSRRRGFRCHARGHIRVNARSTVTHAVERVMYTDPDMSSHEDTQATVPTAPYDAHTRKTRCGEHTPRPHIRHAHGRTALVPSRMRRTSQSTQMVSSRTRSSTAIY